MKQTILYMSI